MTIKLCKQYICKMEEDMAKMHNRHIQMVKEMEDSFQRDNANEYQEWKENAKSRIKAYRKAIEELIIQLEQAQTEKNEAAIELKHQISIAKHYEENQENWENIRIQEIEELKLIHEDELNRKLQENKNKIISYEGQIEDLNMHISSIKKDSDNLCRKYKLELDKIVKTDIEISVKG